MLPNIEAVCRETLAATREIFAEKLRAGEGVNGQRFEITDEAGIVRALPPMRDALKPA